MIKPQGKIIKNIINIMKDSNLALLKINKQKNATQKIWKTIASLVYETLIWSQANILWYELFLGTYGTLIRIEHILGYKIKFEQIIHINRM